MAEYQANLNAGYAEFYALAYGAPPRVPPPPPPSVDNGVDFGTGLPFSLTDPAWQVVPNSNGVRIWDVTTGTGTTLANGAASRRRTPATSPTARSSTPARRVTRRSAAA